MTTSGHIANTHGLPVQLLKQMIFSQREISWLMAQGSRLFIGHVFVMAAVRLSSVPVGISMSRVSATLKKALSFRAVDIALRVPQREDKRLESVELFRDVSWERISERTSCEDRHSQRTVQPTQSVYENIEVHKIAFPQRIPDNGFVHSTRSRVRECNSGLPSKLGTYLNFGKRRPTR